jgi:maltooligosyltrehalose trehalohydrolase
MPDTSSNRFGPLLRDGSTTFRLWAPRLDKADLIIRDNPPLPMVRAEDGFLTIEVDGAGPGTEYMFRAKGLTFPDLASRQQQDGTAGWSIVQAPRAAQERQPVRPWHETVICEVHVGTATAAGTFVALADQLEHFRDAGFTCLEILPVNAFPGTRNWGYDGTLIFAPAGAYGTPDDLRYLVARAHELGLSMILDVVYNHFGETDNFVSRYAPEWFSEQIDTPWGPAINFEEAMVRQFYYENAAMWLADYDFDGLRFDSVHEIKTSARDRFLGELAEAAKTAKPDCKLILENVENSSRWLERDDRNQPMTYTAQWNDDMHHVLAYLVTG